MMHRSILFICLVMLAPLSRAIPGGPSGDPLAGGMSDPAQSDAGAAGPQEGRFLRADDSVSDSGTERHDHPYLMSRSFEQPGVKLRVGQPDHARARWQADAERRIERMGAQVQAYQQRATLSGRRQLHRDWNFQLRMGGAQQRARGPRGTPAAHVEARMDYRIDPRHSLSLRARYGRTIAPGTSRPDWAALSAVLNLRF